MISKEDYTLSYNYYLGTVELDNRRSILEVNSLYESIEVLEEANKETIKKYVDFVISGIQKAWNKFKDNVNKTKFKWKEEQINDAIQNHPVDLTVKNYIYYDTEPLTNFQIQALDYNTMKDNLDDQKTFLKTYYSSFYTDENKSVYDNLKSKCTKSTSETYKVTKDDLVKMFDYMKNHKSYLDKIEKDLNNINQASKNTQFISGVVSGGGTSTTESFFGYFTEDGEEKPEIVKSDDTTDNNRESKGDPNKDIEDKIKVYFKSVSEILSAQMKLSREIYKFYDSVVSEHVKKFIKEGNNESKEEPKVEERSNGAAQISL